MITIRLSQLRCDGTSGVGARRRLGLRGLVVAALLAPIAAGAEKLRVREGRHTFRVVATDSADNIDPTADKHRFKILG